MSSADVDALVARAESVLASDGSIPVANLGPKTVRADVARALAARGFDVGKSKVERSARDRVRALLADGAFLPIASMKTRVPGLSPARAKEIVAELVAAGEARVVLRTAKETLVPARAPTIDAREIAALGRALGDLAKTCAAATKKGVGLLREDVDVVLARARELAPDARRSGAPPPRPLEDVIRGFADGATGLAFVPSVVEALAPRSPRDVHADLLRAAAAGRIELRPEGGLGRLSQRERDACVPGPDGGVLSWARVVGAPT